MNRPGTSREGNSPRFTRTHQAHEGPRRPSTASDAVWLSAQSVLIMGIGLVTTALAARVYGPTTMGYITYAVAYTSLFAPLVRLGLDSILIHELLSRPQHASRTLATTIGLRVAAAVATLGLIWVSLQVYAPAVANPLWILVIGCSTFSMVGEALLAALQAQGLIRNGVIARIVASMLTASARIAILLNDLPLLWFVASYALDAALMIVAMGLTYLARGRFAGTHGFDLRLAGRLLGRGWPLIASGLAVAVYGRIDQIMIGGITGSSRETALYAAATTLGEIWYFVPTALITVMQVKILALSPGESEFGARIQELYRAVALTCLVFCVGLTLFGWLAMRAVFGAAYTTSASVASIVILTWAGLFAMLGTARAPWMIAHELQRYSMIYLLGGCLVNVALNLIMIPWLGIIGAAVSTLLAQMVVALLAPLLFRRTRPIVGQLLGALHPAALLTTAGAGLALINGKAGHR